MAFQEINKGHCKTYLIAEDGQKEIILVDPVIDLVDDYMELIEHNQLTLHAIIETHTHADHISGAPALKDRTGCIHIMHEASHTACAGIRMKDGDKYNIGNLEMKMIHTPGHTKDSMSILMEDKILTGDVLFLNDSGAGRDDLPGGDPGDHWESLEKIKKLPDSLMVYPAHEYRGYEPSTLGEQKKNNPHLKERTKEEFINYINELKLGPADWMKNVLSANYKCARDPKAAWIPVDMPACEVKGTLNKSANDQVVKLIPPEQVYEMLKSDSPPLIIDVRERLELGGNPGKIEGARNIPIGELVSSINEIEEFRDKTVITVCRSGGRSYTAAQILMQAGFTYIYSMEGGMIAWQNLMASLK